MIAANGPRGMALAARHGAGWVTTGRPTGDWWTGVAELARRFEAPIDRYLNADAAPHSPLASVDAFEDTVGRAAELGFTDLIVRFQDGAEPVLDAVSRAFR